MEYILVGTAVAGISLVVLFFLRSTQEAREEFRLAAGSDMGAGSGEEFEANSAVMSGIFSRDDEEFVRGESNPLLTTLFRRERKRLALRWVERRKLEASAIMRRHRSASRSAADLQSADEVVLILRHARLRLTCEFLSVSVWMIGPQGLQRLAGQANAILEGVQNLNARADGDGRKLSV